MTDWKLTDKHIYKLLKHPYEIDKSVIDDMTFAYYEFVEELFGYINNEKDNKELIRTLNTSYVDFETLKSLEESSPTEHSKLKIVFLEKLMSLIDMETKLVFRQMEYPKFFFNIEEWKSPFYLNPKVISYTDIMELACGIFYIPGGILRYDNKTVYFNEFVHCFEKIFNVDIKDVYKKESTVIKRTPNKLTGFIDRMKGVIFKKSKDAGYNT